MSAYFISNINVRCCTSLRMHFIVTDLLSINVNALENNDSDSRWGNIVAHRKRKLSTANTNHSQAEYNFPILISTYACAQVN